MKYRNWRNNNPEKIQEYNHKYYLIHKEKAREQSHNRYARKKSNGGKLTEKEWQTLKEYYKFTCLRCGRKEPEIKLTRDHVLSLKTEGRHEIKNIQPLCKSCNSSKRNKYIDYR